MDNKVDGLSISDSGSVVDDAVRKSLRDLSEHIAHDFNNLLTVQLAYPELIKKDLPEGSKGYELLDIMEDNAGLMTSIANRLAYFSMPSDYAKQPLSVDNTVRKVLSEFDSDDLSFGITVRHELNSECDAMIPYDVLCRILREICTNSFESMNGSGTLTVETNIMNVDGPMTINNCVVPLGSYACITVSDSGSGINDDVRKKAFEPFFTVSKQSKARGTGLGLTIAFAAVRDCDGFLLLGDASAGCSVSIILPVALAEDNPVVEVLPESSEAPELSRVLVVDDEEEITKLFKIMLVSAIDNIHVDIAHNGCEAVEKFKKHNHSVIIMDLHMPVMDGQEAFEKLKQLCASTGVRMPSVIFCTGYIPPEGIKQAISGDTEHSLLQKPVTIKSLISAVKERLSA